MILREPLAAEHAAVARLGRSGFARLGDYRAAITGWLRNPGIASRVAVVDGALAGFVQVAVLDEPGDRHGYILAIGVDEAHRRRGVGAALLREAVELLATSRTTLAIDDVRATVAEDNLAAQALFGAAGFVRQAPTDTAYPAGQRALTLARPIP